MGNFYSDVICKDARFAALTRVSDPSLLEPATRQLVQSVVSAAQRMGIEVMIYETYRSQNRQQELFNNGATKLRSVGVHHYGLACDIVRVAAGEPCWKGDFSFLGQLARSCGLIWGGDWGTPEIKHSFVDSVHVQRCTVARQGDLFAAGWYPDNAYNPYDDGRHLFAAAMKANAIKRPVQAEVATRRSRASKKQG
jgi:D-alanyl-D-alanine carboxypeptidase